MARNPRIQTMFRMIGLGDNIGSGFLTILNAWGEENWRKPDLSRSTARLENEVTNTRLQAVLDLHSTEVGKFLAELVEKQMLIAKWKGRWNRLWKLQELPQSKEL